MQKAVVLSDWGLLEACPRFDVRAVLRADVERNGDGRLSSSEAPDVGCQFEVAVPCWGCAALLPTKATSTFTCHGCMLARGSCQLVKALWPCLCFILVVAV